MFAGLCWFCGLVYWFGFDVFSGILRLRVLVGGFVCLLAWFGVTLFVLLWSVCCTWLFSCLTVGLIIC